MGSSSPSTPTAQTVQSPVSTQSTHPVQPCKKWKWPGLFNTSVATWIGLAIALAAFVGFPYFELASKDPEPLDVWKARNTFHQTCIMELKYGSERRSPACRDELSNFAQPPPIFKRQMSSKIEENSSQWKASYYFRAIIVLISTWGLIRYTTASKTLGTRLAGPDYASSFARFGLAPLSMLVTAFYAANSKGTSVITLESVEGAHVLSKRMAFQTYSLMGLEVLGGYGSSVTFYLMTILFLFGIFRAYDILSRPQVYHRRPVLSPRSFTSPISRDSYNICLFPLAVVPLFCVPTWLSLTAMF